jgi:hypothetical protein
MMFLWLWSEACDGELQQLCVTAVHLKIWTVLDFVLIHEKMNTMNTFLSPSMLSKTETLKHTVHGLFPHHPEFTNLRFP